MAIEISKFLADMKEIRKHIDPEEKIRQWQELKQKSQFVNREDCKTGPFLLVMKAEEKKKKERK